MPTANMLIGIILYLAIIMSNLIQFSYTKDMWRHLWSGSAWLDIFFNKYLFVLLTPRRRKLFC